VSGKTCKVCGVNTPYTDWDFCEKHAYTEFHRLLKNKRKKEVKRTRREDLEHPMQPVGFDELRTVRFKENPIIRWMLQQGEVGATFTLNTIAAQRFDPRDREQLAQLIGYSVGGFEELSYARPETIEIAQAAAALLRK